MPRRRTIILASASPRRLKIVSQLLFKVEVIPSNADETLPEGEKPVDAVRTIATRKAEAVARTNQGVIVAADTMVELGGKLYGKPKDAADNARMLSELRGKKHTIITGITVMDTSTGMIMTDANVAHIEMRDYSDREIADYAASGDGLDAAGGYNVLSDGRALTKDISGCENGIAGLPLCKLLEMLFNLGIKVDKKYYCKMLNGDPCPNTRPEATS